MREESVWISGQSQRRGDRQDESRPVESAEASLFFGRIRIPVCNALYRLRLRKMRAFAGRLKRLPPGAPGAHRHLVVARGMLKGRVIAVL